LAVLTTHGEALLPVHYSLSEGSLVIKRGRHGIQTIDRLANGAEHDTPQAPSYQSSYLTIFLLMKRRLFILLSAACLLSACKSREPAAVRDADITSLQMPTWSFMANANGSFQAGRTDLPKRAYVFPALRLDTAGQVMDQLSHRQDPAAGLLWHSTAPLGSELQIILERQLQSKGFELVSFDALAKGMGSHSVTVFNPYYKEAETSRYNKAADPDESWVSIIRIEGATYPEDLDPNARLEVLHLELVALFNGKPLSSDVARHSIKYLIKNLGRTGQWTERVNLL